MATKELRISWYVRSMLVSQHPRLGPDSPASLLCQDLHRELLSLVFESELLRRFWEPHDGAKVSEDGLTLVQIANCKNFVCTASPPVEPGSFLCFQIRIERIGSGTMRYLGCHTAEGSNTPWPSETKARYNICIQDERLDRSGISDAVVGDVFTVAINSADQDIDGVSAHTMTFWRNGNLIQGGTKKLPPGIPLWPAMTQQTKNDTVTATWGCEVPKNV